MPTIQRLPNCTITLYAGDHLPPHFHVRLQDGREALVEIANLVVLSGASAAGNWRLPWNGLLRTRPC